MMHLFLAKKDKVKSFENIISRFVETVESQIDVQAESLCKLSIENGLFKAFCSFSISETKVTNEEAKKVMLPYTKKILAEFGSIGLGVKFRVKMDSAENIEKIGIHLHLHLKSEESRATEEDNRPKEI